jgi:hypothetical protein
MWNWKSLTASRVVLLLGAAILTLGVAWPLAALAQNKTDQAKDHAQHADKDLAAQVAELRAKVAKLEAALKQGHQGQPSGAPNKGMGMMGGMMMDEGGMMGGMAGKGGMGMMDMDRREMMGMMGMAPKGMAEMKGMGKMQMAAALPGFPGASHIYHVGATGFFLDHPDHITLTAKQQSDLARLKEKALLAKATAQRKIEEAEQELWTLTASDRPDADRIEAKVREVEKSRGDQRLAFIRAVGEAAKVLTDEQRQALLGTGAGKAAKPNPHAGH